MFVFRFPIFGISRPVFELWIFHLPGALVFSGFRCLEAAISGLRSFGDGLRFAGCRGRLASPRGWCLVLRVFGAGFRVYGAGFRYTVSWPVFGSVRIDLSSVWSSGWKPTGWPNGHGCFVVLSLLIRPNKSVPLFNWDRLQQCGKLGVARSAFSLKSARCLRKKLTQTDSVSHSNHQLCGHYAKSPDH